MQTKGNRKSGVTKKRGIRKTKKGGNKSERQKNRGLGKSKKTKGRTRRQPRIYGGVWPFSTKVAPAPILTGRELEELIDTYRTVEADGAVNIEQDLQKIEIVRDLIHEGAKINERFSNGETALTTAAYFRSHEMVKLLIELGADVNTTNAEGFTPLMKANSYLRLEGTHRIYDTSILINTVPIINALIAAGANVNAKNEVGNTALHFAVNHVRSGHFYSVSNATNVDVLIKAGAVVTVKNNDGNTPLHVAKNLNAIDLLIKAGADVNAKTNEDLTALDFANLMNKILIPEKPRIIELLQAEMAKHAPPANAETLPQPITQK